MVERLAALMRRRAADRQEALVVSDSERWLRVSVQATLVDRFLADGFEAGYVWDEHMVSVANKQVRRPKKDGWYEHGQELRGVSRTQLRLRPGDVQKTSIDPRGPDPLARRERVDGLSPARTFANRHCYRDNRAWRTTPESAWAKPREMCSGSRFVINLRELKRASKGNRMPQLPKKLSFLDGQMRNAGSLTRLGPDDNSTEARV